ncbi:MAG TPA: putative toxin-antitoxin system toxin component, PIN family [Verrucomicrobiota bacterium]|nr:putative toxin-antitoxin system toxin component, PIN family [Verrucomicrobiota bacterium]HRZ38909.1 putative toxin-antitoxin system toxin component, PIN family [Candidatus Paceibacterota bacterium]
MIVVFDTNVVVEAIFWPRSTARRALTGLALRRFKTAVSQDILDEYAAVTGKLRARLFAQAQPSGPLAWIAAKSVRAEPMPLADKLSRDADDNVFVATAAADKAAFLVTQDRDLLVLEKPFGVQIVTPVQLIRELQL